MRLDFVEIAGFRGFRDKARFEFPPGFAVLCGRNGAGKSSVFDAVDFAVTGTINKFMARRARGGGIEDNIWWVGDDHPSEQFVRVGFIADNGQRFAIERRPSAPISAAEIAKQTSPLFAVNGAEIVSVETLMQMTLIRDELIVSLRVRTQSGPERDDACQGDC